jgi:hypothetical protein
VLLRLVGTLSAAAAGAAGGAAVDAPLAHCLAVLTELAPHALG